MLGSRTSIALCVEGALSVTCSGALSPYRAVGVEGCAGILVVSVSLKCVGIVGAE